MEAICGGGITQSMTLEQLFEIAGRYAGSQEGVPPGDLRVVASGVVDFLFRYSCRLNMQDGTPSSKEGQFV